jgi:hypothetical protein
VYILKTDGSGNIQWHKVYGGTENDAANAVQETSTGDYIVTGYTNSFGEGTPSFQNIYVLKLTSSGGILWEKTYDNSINDNDEAFGVEETIDGNYIVCGTSTIGSSTHQDATLLKLNSSNGNKIWSKTYGSASGDEIAYNVKQTADGGFMLAGTSNSFSSSRDCFLLKIDATGNTVQWAKVYVTSDGANSEACRSLIATADNGYALYGDVFYAASSRRYELLIKTDSSGIVSWSNQYGGGNNDYGNKVLQSSDNGYLLTSWQIADFGFSGATAHIIKTNANGLSGCNETAVSITATSPVIVVGSGPTESAGGNSIGSEAVTVSDEALPVNALCQNLQSAMKFLSFEGTNNTDKNILKWKTAYEINCNYYKIERSSDRTNFHSIGRLNAVGNSNSVCSYKYIDDKNIRGIMYYRIKGVGINGDATYSRIVKIRKENVIFLNTYGRSGMFLIKSEEEYSAPFVEYIVFNSIGSKVYQGRFKNNGVKIFSTMDLSFLASGVYFVRFNAVEGITGKKIVILH